MKRAIIMLVLVTSLLMLTTIVSANDALDPATIPFSEACTGITLENITPSELCMQVMAARPSPSYPQVPLDSGTINSYSFYKVIGATQNVYNTPNGAITRSLGAGFNFVRVLDANSSPGWVQIEGGEWMRAEDLELVAPSDLRGLRIDDGLADPFAWILGNVVTSSFPGAPADGRRFYYYNLVNIYATVELGGWRWYMVGPDQWVEQRNVSKPTLIDRPEGVSGRWVSVDLYEQSMVAYEDDEPVFATVIASGLPEWETNEGLFTVWYRVASGSMSGASGAPDAYALQSVPWTLYYDGDISLHGAYWHSSFGFRRSHGCVNMSISDSRWLFEWTAEADGPLDEEGRLQTYVYVYSSGEYT